MICYKGKRGCRESNCSKGFRFIAVTSRSNQSQTIICDQKAHITLGIYHQITFTINLRSDNQDQLLYDTVTAWNPNPK